LKANKRFKNIIITSNLMDVSEITQDTGPIPCWFFRDAKMRKVAKRLQGNIDGAISNRAISLDGQVDFLAKKNHSYGHSQSQRHGFIYPDNGMVTVRVRYSQPVDLRIAADQMELVKNQCAAERHVVGKVNAWYGASLCVRVVSDYFGGTWGLLESRYKDTVAYIEISVDKNSKEELGEGINDLAESAILFPAEVKFRLPDGQLVFNGTVPKLALIRCFDDYDEPAIHDFFQKARQYSKKVYRDTVMDSGEINFRLSDPGSIIRISTPIAAERPLVAEYCCATNIQ
jgi:hypothetical protein